MLWYDAGAWVKSESSTRQPSDTAWESYIDAVPPALPVRPSLALQGNCAAHSHMTCTPRPSNEDGGTLKRITDAYPAPARDDVVTLDYWIASPPPTPALCSHPCCCAAIPSTAAPFPDDKTSTSPPLYILRPSVNYTLEPAYRQRLKRKPPTQPPSKPLLGRHRTRHDAH
jgi:hypothetical protein